MITVNGSTQLATVLVNEGYKKHEDRWEKVLIVQFPKGDYTLDAATEICQGANNITSATEAKVTTYYVDGIMATKEDLYYHNIWMYNPEVSVEDNLTAKVRELEQIIDTLLGGDETDA